MSRLGRKYLRADLVLRSPLKISSGADDLTDADVLVDATGTPFLPGTSIAGVMRHHAAAAHAGEEVGGRPYADHWFGYVVPFKDEGDESLVQVLDAFPIGETHVSTRDGVRLDEDKVAVAQGKYDYQVVDAGARFRLRMVVKYRATGAKEDPDQVLSDFAWGVETGDVRLGGKTSRGFGELRLENMETLDVDLGTDGGVDAYVGFDWEKSEFEPLGSPKQGPKLPIAQRTVPLDLVSSLMIRDYGTVVRSGHEEKLVDAETLKGADGKPVVPGTSWAGAFRSHMRKVLQAAGYDGANGKGETTSAFLNRMFGTHEGARPVASKVAFSESVVERSTQLISTRTAIDRFTGGAAHQKLFTTQMAFDGDTELRIRWRTDIGADDLALLESLIDVCVADLCDGTLAVGGMTATGSGMFAPHDADREVQ